MLFKKKKNDVIYNYIKMQDYFDFIIHKQLEIIDKNSNKHFEILKFVIVQIVSRNILQKNW